MRFSIIVPIYNVEKFLPNCIESIIKQDFSDFEILLINDGSTDDCYSICKKFARIDTRIRIINQENKGLVQVRKTGAKEARGEYIVSVDGDDYIEKDLLSHINKKILENNKQDVLFWWATSLNENGEKNKIIKWMYEYKMYDVSSKEISNTFLYDSNRSGINDGSLPINICLKAIKKNVYEDCQMLVDNGVTKGEDALFTFFLLKNAHSFLPIENFGYVYRVVANSMSRLVKNDDFIKLDFLTRIMIDNLNYTFIKSNQIFVYYFWRVFGLLFDLARKSKTYKSFYSSISYIDIIFYRRCIQNVEIKKKKLKDIIKLNLLKKEKWHLFYFYAKHLH